MDELLNALQWDRLGAAASRAGDFGRAAHCFEQVLARNPGCFEALNNLAVNLQKLGDLDGAAVRYAQAAALRPNHLSVRFNLAVLRATRGELHEALNLASQIIEQAPRFMAAYLLASALEAELERFDAALARSAAALALAPDDPVVLARHAEVLLQNGEAASALAICDNLLSLEPGHAKAGLVRAMALQDLDRCDEALIAFDAAAESAKAPALTAKAWLLAELGRKAEALTILDRALTFDPADAKAWSEKASLIKFAAGDPALLAMERLAGSPTTPHAGHIKLCFALGRGYLDHGDGARAFAWLGRGNRAKRAIIRYDAQEEGAAMMNIARVYSADRLAQRGEHGQRPDQPVFVFGMPRSGTTLLEHILAAHPDVAGLGEPPALSRIAASLDGQWPSPDAAAAHRQTYLGFCAAAARGRRRTVDKTPSNFLHAGLISLMLPGAKMIHCRRDPVDTCLSCYSLLFARGYPFTYDLTELGDYYRLYLRLVAHWRRVLPPDQWLDIDYERLISDGGATIRRVLDFCGLPFQDACLRPHETARRVTSASLGQVRSPVYQTSAGRAAPFMPWLEALGDFPDELRHRPECA